MGCGQPLVELVVDGRQDGLQPRHIDLGVVVQRVEPVVTKGFDHVPDIHQMNCEQTDGGQSSLFMLELLVVQCSERRGSPLTVASLLHKPEFAGGSVSRQSDHVEVLSSFRKKQSTKKD